MKRCTLRDPSLLIQPLVENAIVHGIQPCKGKGVVTISVKDLGNRVRIAVRDTGHGIQRRGGQPGSAQRNAGQ